MKSGAGLQPGSGVPSDGWVRNLIDWSGAQPGEHVGVIVDEPNAAEGEQLLRALQAHGAEAELALWAGEGSRDRP